MLIFSFIMSIIFSVVLVTFIVGSIILSIRNNRYSDEVDELINGYQTYDLTDSVGGADEEKE